MKPERPVYSLEDISLTLFEKFAINLLTPLDCFWSTPNHFWLHYPRDNSHKSTWEYWVAEKERDYRKLICRIEREGTVSRDLTQRYKDSLCGKIMLATYYVTRGIW